MPFIYAKIVKNGIIKMAHSKEVRNEAIRLYEENWHVTDISSRLNVPLRTVQRWLSSANKDKLPEPSKESLQISFNPQNSIFNDLDNIDESKANWQTIAEIASSEQSSISRDIRNRAYEAFKKALNDENWRAVQVLSNVINKSLADEYRSRSLHYLDVNRAVELLIKHRVELDSYEQNINSR